MLALWSVLTCLPFNAHGSVHACRVATSAASVASRRTAAACTLGLRIGERAAGAGRPRRAGGSGHHHHRRGEGRTQGQCDQARADTSRAAGHGVVPSELLVWLGSDCASALPAAPSEEPASPNCCFNAASSDLGIVVGAGTLVVLPLGDRFARVVCAAAAVEVEVVPALAGAP